MQFKTFINAKTPRIKHKDGSIKSVEIPWASVGNRHTFLFEILVIDWLLASKNQTQTAKMLRCGFNLVNRIMHNACQRGLDSRSENIEESICFFMQIYNFSPTFLCEPFYF